MWQSTFFVSILTMAPLILAGNTESVAESSCLATPKLEVVAAIAPASGAFPVWVVDGSFGHWRGPEAIVKTAWILARDNPGDLTVVARKLDGDGRALFEATQSGDVSERLFIAAAETQQMIPGGIKPDALRRYSFRASGVIYPSAGCWEFEVHYGKTKSRIVIEITDQP